MSQLQTTDEANGNKVLNNLLQIVADEADRMRPGAGNCVREMAEEKYPEAEDRPLTLGEFCQHLANLCPRHIHELLPPPTESVCADCTAEREARQR